MDEKAIIYLVLGVVWMLYKVFGKRNQQQNQPPPPPPTYHEPQQQQRPVQPPAHKGEKSLLETIMEEVEKQKKLSEAKPPQMKPRMEIKQKVQRPEKKNPRKVEEFLPSQWGREELRDDIDHVEREEGVSSISDRLKRSVSAVPEQEQERKFEFDPREAFMMKTLFERPYS